MPAKLLKYAPILFAIVSTLWRLKLVVKATQVERSLEVDANGHIHTYHDKEISIEEAVDPGLPLEEENQEEEEEEDDDDVEDECGLYLAPSTVEGAGLGIFTTRPLKVGDYVGNGEVVIPMVEVPFYNGNKEDLFNPFVHYYWKGSEKGLHGIVGDHRIHEIHAFVPGLDAAINCNLALINVDNAGAEYDNSNLDRYRDPMAGGMTPYLSTPSKIIRHVPKGGELFKFYGDQWFIARPEQFGLTPLSEDYPKAQELVNKFNRLRKKYFRDNTELGEELWDLARYFIGSLMWESRTMNALPYIYEDAQLATAFGIDALHQPGAVRTNKYLRKHGKCMDSFRPGPSTLESKQGGKGAFATRNFSKGTIITGSPLHHLDKELVTIYDMELVKRNSTTGEETWRRHQDKVVGYQIMLNYCYGHPQSTLLLCPYASNIGYINHNKTRANIKIQWAQDGITRHNQSWLENKTLKELEFEYQIGLAFDYVATKDIKEGDEVFLDYGDEFEEALKKHMERWQPPKDKIPGYIPAELFDKQMANSPLHTEDEQKAEPYPENVELHCHAGLVYGYLKPDMGYGPWETREKGFPCRILERYPNPTWGDGSEKNKFLYKVEMKLPLEEVGRQFRADAFTYFQKSDVQRDAIKFFNKPYTTDFMLPNTFRKEIGIPDEMFPAHWKNGPAITPGDDLVEEGPKVPYRYFDQLGTL